MNLVWLKRDLRVEDHQALCRALECGPTAALFVIEPEWTQSVEFSWDHFRFAMQSLQSVERDLAGLGIPLLVLHGSMPDCLNRLQAVAPITGLFSHEETGLAWTFDRDLRVAEWCRQRSIPWNEARQFGVTRRLKDRNTWVQKRNSIVVRSPVKVKGQSAVQCPWNSNGIPMDWLVGKSLMSQPQKGGRSEAAATLQSFFDQRGQHYFRSISSPITAVDGCSRMSPYLAWGVVSMTEILNQIEAKRKQLPSIEPQSRREWEKSLQAFESRLFWHCHFIQKLESEPQIEFHNFNREFDGMREADWNESRFQAWCRGQTGFPMIDACMRALHQHGWINFRMRAMLLSFASYQLWLHWKKPAEFLARHFIDFEPGIHYSQAQMQSGVTGINTVRIYSPVKQQQDQDPTGEFVRRYVPELASLSNADLFAPQDMPPLLQATTGFRVGVDYPEPIVDPESSYRLAKQKIFDWKQRPKTRKASERVMQRHGSRRRQDSKRLIAGPSR